MTASSENKISREINSKENINRWKVARNEEEANLFYIGVGKIIKGNNILVELMSQSIDIKL